MLLFINTCARKGSRTKLLADRLLDTLGKPFVQLDLTGADLPCTDEDFLNRRDELIRQGRFDDPMFKYARQFADADEIVIAAPYWDLSFPAVLKAYFEQINAIGVTFCYTEDGVPKGLCKASRLFYVTTAGGEFTPECYGFGYVKALSEQFYGIADIELIKATGLDILGADTERIIQDCEKDIIRRFGSQK